MSLSNSDTIYPASDPEFVSFPSRRSVVHSTKGIIACTQPLASQAGLRILSQGGNAAVGGPLFCDGPLLMIESGCCCGRWFVRSIDWECPL